MEIAKGSGQPLSPPLSLMGFSVSRGLIIVQ